MKITFILPGYCLKPVGGAKVVYEYANRLAKRGHEVCVIHPNFMNNLPKKQFHWLRTIVRYFVKPRKRKWMTISDKIKMIYVPEPAPDHIPPADAVFATAWQTAEYVRDYPPSKGRKYYLIQHYETWNGGNERVDATWRGPLKKIVIAKWLYNKGLELGIRKDDMFYVPNGIDHQVYRLAEPVEGRSMRIGMMYFTAEWKGSSNGIKALQIMHERFPAVQAVVFGQYEKPKELPDWVHYWRYPDKKEIVEKIYNRISIFLCTSWTEGAPAPPAEAMACGCALVSTDCTGIDEYAENGATALLSPVKDPEAMAGNLIKLLGDDGLRIKLAKAGHERIKGFNWEHSTDLLEKAIK